MYKSFFIILTFILISQYFLLAEGKNNGNDSVRDTLKVKDKSELLNLRNDDAPPTWYQMLVNVPSDDYEFFRNSFESPKIPAYIGLTALTGSLMTVDHSGWKFDHRLYGNSHLFHSAADISVFMGTGQFHFMLSGLFATYGLFNHDEIALRTASNIAESVLAAGLLVQVLKRVTGRESPAGSDKTLGSWKFFPSIKEYQKNQSHYYSFPSGHLASATATLTVIANNYPQIKWIKPVGYTILGCLGISLVSRGMHWYSDLPLGFFIGYSIGNIVSPKQTIQTKEISSNTTNFIVMPNIGYNRVGLNVAYTF